MSARFLVTGCGRSGTTFVARLLSALGIPCGHEAVFDVGPLAAGEAFWPADVPGEASWLGAPYMLDLPPGSVVLHQVREPLAVVRSLMRMRFFHRPSSDPAYAAFAVEHFPALAQGEPLERCIAYWVGWNRLAEQASAVPGLRYVRYRLEDMGVELLEQLCGVLEHPFDAARAEAALRALPADVNTRGERSEDAALRWQGLAPGGLLTQARALASAYGYGEPLPSGALEVRALPALLTGAPGDVPGDAPGGAAAA